MASTYAAGRQTNSQHSLSCYCLETGTFPVDAQAVNDNSNCDCPEDHFVELVKHNRPAHSKHYAEKLCQFPFRTKFALFVNPKVCLEDVLTV